MDNQFIFGVCACVCADNQTRADDCRCASNLRMIVGVIQSIVGVIQSIEGVIQSIVGVIQS